MSNNKQINTAARARKALSAEETNQLADYLAKRFHASLSKNGSSKSAFNPIALFMAERGIA
jgi:hypothetical protein